MMTDPSTPSTPPNDEQPVSDEQHLANLKALVQNAIADGKLSRSEMDEIRAALFADGKLTMEEIELVRDVMKAGLGDGHLEFDPD